MSAGARIWIVCQQPLRVPGAFEVRAVCATERLAVNLCLTPRHFLGPLELDRLVPTSVDQWAGAYFPRVAPKL